jgi:hypothetical protein
MLGSAQMNLGRYRASLREIEKKPVQVSSVMRHGAESPRPMVPDTCGGHGVVRLLIVGSNPTLTTN